MKILKEFLRPAPASANSPLEIAPIPQEEEIKTTSSFTEKLLHSPDHRACFNLAVLRHESPESTEAHFMIHYLTLASVNLRPTVPQKLISKFFVLEVDEYQIQGETAHYLISLFAINAQSAPAIAGAMVNYRDGVRQPVSSWFGTGLSRRLLHFANHDQLERQAMEQAGLPHQNDCPPYLNLGSTIGALIDQLNRKQFHQPILVKAHRQLASPPPNLLASLFPRFGLA